MNREQFEELKKLVYETPPSELSTEQMLLKLKLVRSDHQSVVNTMYSVYGDSQKVREYEREHNIKFEREKLGEVNYDPCSYYREKHEHYTIIGEEDITCGKGCEYCKVGS